MPNRNDHPERNDSASDALRDNARVEEAMELYLSQLESGAAPDRAEILKQFADVADELAGQLETLEFLHLASPEVAGGQEDDPPQNIGVANQTLGDFRLRRQIGQGGMGIVYEAIQLSLDRSVAVKILPFAAMFDAKQRQRFKNEARAAATLEHPNIVPIYFVGQERGVHFYAMQLIDGQSLTEVIQGLKNVDLLSGDGRGVAGGGNGRDTASLSATTLSTQRSQAKSDYYRSVAELGIQVARALQHAHERGVVHRDIKPGNLLLDEAGKVWITDFGLARFENNESMTGQGDVLGTIAYMSPEQISGSSLVDARSDIYSLAATLYELLTLQRPFAAKTKSGTRTLRSRGSLSSPRDFDPQIDSDLETIVLKALSDDPGDRYQAAEDLADDLQRFASGRTIQARRPTLGDRALKWTSRHKRFAATMAFAMMALCSVLLVSSVLVWRARLEAEEALARAEQNANQVQDLLYLSDVQVAYQAWDNEQLEKVNEILSRHIPDDGKPDRRGYEWYALKSLAVQIQPEVIGSHAGGANQVAVFPDGRRIASVGNDKKLRVWDLESQLELFAVDMGDSSPEVLFSVAVSPDGQTVATGSDCVQLWDARTGERMALLAAFDANVQSVTFSPDGQWIVIAPRYESVQLFRWRLSNLSVRLQVTLGTSLSSSHPIVRSYLFQADVLSWTNPMVEKASSVFGTRS